MQGVSTRHPGETASSVKFFPLTRVEAGFSAGGGGASLVAAAVTLATAATFVEAAGFAEGAADAVVVDGVGAVAVDAAADGTALGAALATALGVPTIAIVCASLGTAIALALGAPLAPPSVLLQPETTARAAITPDACTFHVFITPSSDLSP